MGQLFGQGGLTTPNSAMIDPSSGQATAIGTPNQMMLKAGKQLKDTQNAYAASDIAGNPQTPSPVSQLGTPTFRDAASAGALPGGENVMSPGLNKAGKLITLLTSGLQGAMAGRAANEQATVASGGRRSGGAGMGFEAGYQLPWQRAGMAEQFAQEQAKTKLLQQQGDMIQTPGGPMPLSLAKVFYPAAIRGQTAETVQGMKGTTAENIQGQKNVGAMNVAQAHISAEQLKFAIQNGQVARVTDGMDENGQPAKIAYNRMGQPMGVLPGALPSSRYLPTETNTVSYQQDANGNILALPKQGTSQKVLPGGSPARPSGTPQARIVNGPGGAPLQGKIPPEVGKAFSTYQDSQSRYNIMQQNYKNATNSNDQQAMLSLLANHLGMTMGLAKGARINQAIIREAEQSRPWLQGMASKFDKDGYLSGVTLTPTQMDQMITLAHDRLGEDLRKYQAMKQFYANAGTSSGGGGANVTHVFVPGKGLQPAQAGQ